MLSRVIPLLLTLLLGATLAGCGDDTGEPGGSSGAPEQLEIQGDPGKAPEVTWDGRLEVSEVSTEVLVEGDGDEVSTGDQVLAHIWIGNGYSQAQVYSSYDQGQPQQLTVDEKQLSPVFIEGLEGQTYGSRVVVTAPAEDAFGEGGNAQLGIGNKDTVVLVIDPVEPFSPPEPKDVPAAQLPEPVIEKGDPVGFDFSGVEEPEPGGELLRSVLEKGNGKTVTTDMEVTANYLGAVYGAKKPFDESFSKKPVPFQLTGVVEGWTYGLEGMKVGSRVVLQIPPELGYGSQQQPGIPADSTLYFVIDIVSAK